MLITRQDRQEILDAFIAKHGKWDPRLFRDEVRAGQWQQAFGWFTWEESDAADRYQVEEAQRFRGGLVVRFGIETIHRGKVVVVQTEAPAYVSPPETRHAAGGYRALDPDNPEHMASFCGEAGVALQAWLNRYESTLLSVDVKPDVLAKVIAALETRVREAA